MLDLEHNEVLTFVTGKGGTGKSFLSCLLAVKSAHEGKRVLLIDSENTGDLTEIFEHEQVGYDPVEVYNNVWISQISTDDSLAEYLKLYAKVPTWAKITPLARLIDLVSHAAPGVKEILVCGKICFETKKIMDGESDFDVIIVDAPSSGHVISLLDAPNALSEMVSKGGLQNQTQWMSEILKANSTNVVITALPEEVVVSETKQLVDEITSRTSISIREIILNRDISYDLDEKSIPKKIDSDSKTIKEVFEYYKQQVKQSVEIRNSFPKHTITSFPRIMIESPNIRTLIKYRDALLPIEVKK